MTESTAYPADHDEAVQAAETNAVKARTAYEQASRANALPLWLRWASWARLEQAQGLGVHWWFRSEAHQAICTCGLRHPHPAPDVATLLGHQAFNPRRETRVLTVPIAAAQGNARAVCQSCGWRSQLALPSRLVNSKRLHQCGDEEPTSD